MGQLCSLVFTDHLSIFWKMIIRPPRAEYDPSELGQSPFQIGGADFERLDLQIINGRGLRLECSHFRPAETGSADADTGAVKKLPCVVYIHGYSSCRLEASDVVSLLLPRGITVFCLDLAGSGLSEGEFVSLGHFEELDIHLVIKHLRGMSSVGGIGLWGRSMGASIAVTCAAKDPSVAACVLDSGFCSIPLLAFEVATKRRGALQVPEMWFPRLYEAVRREVRSRASFDIGDILPIEAAPDATSPALFLVAKDDRSIPVHHTYDLHKAWGGKDKQLVTTEGGHGDPRDMTLMNYVCDFLQQRLSAAAVARREERLREIQGEGRPNDAVDYSV
mmetsp:Transcript_113615/g.321718  ORF Transcript_113615/g.321718 Transcript_113615/m.321718 type:complete len:333 (-) Transcript_113615:112-1110(-)